MSWENKFPTWSWTEEQSVAARRKSASVDVRCSRKRGCWCSDRFFFFVVFFLNSLLLCVDGQCCVCVSVSCVYTWGHPLMQTLSCRFHSTYPSTCGWTVTWLSWQLFRSCAGFSLKLCPWIDLSGCCWRRTSCNRLCVLVARWECWRWCGMKQAGSVFWICLSRHKNTHQLQGLWTEGESMGEKGNVVS